MENYAGFGEYADHEIGRLIDSLKEAGVYDNTLIIYIAGDNGMSAEGGLAGTLNEMTAFNGVPDTTANILAHRTRSAGRTVSPTSRLDGPWRATRRSNGPSRSRRITAARATAW